MRPELRRKGGWGPYLKSPPEPFDTAVVLLALRQIPPTAKTRRWIASGRAFLEASQEEDGGRYGGSGRGF